MKLRPVTGSGKTVSELREDRCPGMLMEWRSTDAPLASPMNTAISRGMCCRPPFDALRRRPTEGSTEQAHLGCRVQTRRKSVAPSDIRRRVRNSSTVGRRYAFPTYVPAILQPYRRSFNPEHIGLTKTTESRGERTSSQPSVSAGT